MSQVKLNLQPPPNVDFVTGYPGIPPGQDRPQASVKGAIEVRVPTQGVKAKWVRIELRKVETLPGGGPANTFYDFVGPSPVNLWSTSDEYGLLRSQDFPFSIRIPESIPPSISLDGKAGIGYELVASVCTKGKKGFLRKAKSVVSSTIAPIIIDKHELHSTWPVYQQPETRHLAQDGVNLLVERRSTCFGPGDPIVVLATVKSDSLHTVILRGFEMALREATVFRAGGAHVAGKARSAPQVRQVTMAETKVPVSATLYGGTAHSAELRVMVQPDHTTTTLNAARHIDITYTLCVRALMGTGAHLVMDLPIVISNWQKPVSEEAIKRIGPAPSLSLSPPAIAAPITRIDPIRPGPSATLPITRTPANDSGYGHGHTRTPSAQAYSTSTLPAAAADDGYNAYGLGRVDEFGASARPVISAATPSASSAGRGSTATATAGAGAAGRFVVKNAEVPQDAIVRQRSAQAQAQGSGSGSGSGSGAAGGGIGQANKQYPSAEEEKRLYEQARAKVALTQGPAAAPPPVSMNASPPRGAAGASSSSSAVKPNQNTWLSAEEEKRLFQEAQAAVARNQGVQPVNAVGGGSGHARSDSDPKASSGSKPSAAELYASARGQQANANARATPAYETAAQEKARYAAALRAVEMTQMTAADEPASPPPPPPTNSEPIAYESLFPGSRGQAQASGAPPPPRAASDDPPPFAPAPGGSSIMAHLSEKERLRRQYEAQDAARLANPSPPPPAPPAAYAASPPAPAPAPVPQQQQQRAGPPPGQYANAFEEKEALRKKFEARDNANANANANVNVKPPAPLQLQPQAQPQPPARAPAPPSPPPPASGGSRSSAIPPHAHTPLPRSPGATASGFRPAPVPPTATAAGAASSSPSKVLTAAEEKAMLRAKYEARDAPPAPPPPAAAAPAKVLTAAEEKALLRAKYEARDAGAGAGGGGGRPQPLPPINANVNANVNGAAGLPSVPTTPPPLMPRPPADYIKETQEEDARVARMSGVNGAGAGGEAGAGGVNGNGNGNGVGGGGVSLDMKPFTPFRAGFDPNSMGSSAGVPPLPLPKSE